MTNDILNYNCIAILGGTFNPVHKGHIMLAKEVIEQITDIEQLFIMPNNMPAYKESDDIISSTHRINMLKIASKHLKKTTVSDMEIIRGGITYTIDTLREFKNMNIDLKIYFIIGADSLYNIEKWREFEDIFDNCVIVAAKRECNLEDIIIYSESLQRKYKNLKIKFLDTEAIDISSSTLREEIKNGIINNEYIDLNVVNYIKDNNLYGWNY